MRVCVNICHVLSIWMCVFSEIGQGGRPEVGAVDQGASPGSAQPAGLLPPAARRQGPLRRHPRPGDLLRGLEVRPGSQSGRSTLGAG